MNRSKKSILNAVFALVQMGVTSIFGLILSRSVLSFFGSDYNGVNSIAMQLVNVIMVLEGGFTLASNVALFKPFMEKNLRKINGILSATEKRFRTVSLAAMFMGIAVAFVFPLCISTQVPYLTCVCLMLTVLLPSCFNLGYSMKYRVILLTDQKEYIISIISAVFYAAGNSIAVLFIRAGYGIVTARIMIMFFLFFSYYFIGVYCKKKYSFVKFTEQPLFNEIAGSRNVLALKVTSMLYSSAPIILISTLPITGAKLASVYAVYKNVISVVQNCLSSVTNAPRLGFGSLLAEGNYKEAEEMFVLYEKISFIGLAIILGTTCLFIMPFVDLYTRGVSDINYHNEVLACIILVTVFLEVCHIPSGQMIQMSGDFKASKNIQSTAFAVLAIGMAVGRLVTGLYGILIAVLLAAVILCVLEIGYTGIKIFKRNWMKFILNMLPSLVICVVATVIGFSGKIICSSYLIFVFVGSVSVIALTCITIGVYYVIDPDAVRKIFGMVKGAVRRK